MGDIILRHDGGMTWGGPSPLNNEGTTEALDIVAGNRYRIEPLDPRLGQFTRAIPDDAGAWLALVTFRGPMAPPRPEALPVGTRVRRGANANWATTEVRGMGTVIDWRNGFCDVRWEHGPMRTHSHMPGKYRLEVVSLPEPAKPEPFVVLALADNCAPNAWMSDGTYIDSLGTADSSTDDARDGFLRSKFVKGRRYRASGKETPGKGWLCVADFTGPDYREPEKAARDYADSTIATAKSPSVDWWNKEGAPKSNPTISEETVRIRVKAEAQTLTPKYNWSATKWGDSRQYRGVPPDAVLVGSQPGNLDNVGREPDILPPHIAKARGRTFVVPTDNGIDLLPDADEETMTGRMR